MSTVLEYFPGANTPGGFFSYYHNILTPAENNRMYIVKGGPGTGKSTFMKKLGTRAKEKGYDVELLHCSSDPDSLDGVTVRELGISVIDGTSPHVCDPIVPGAFDEILNFGDFFDTNKLAKDKDSIIKLQNSISTCFKDAYTYLSAANSICVKCCRHINADINIHAINAALSSIINEIDLSAAFGSGNAKDFFLSGITPLGLINYIQTFADVADKIYVIKNDIHADVSLLFNTVANIMRKQSIDGYIFYCPMSPSDKIEHIYIPALKTFITSSNRFHTVPDSNADVYDIALIANYTPSDIADDEEFFSKMISYASECVKKAKSLHDKLEESYVSAMNFDSLNEYSKNLINSII